MYQDNVKWQDALKNAEHYLALGETDIYLTSRAQDYPWHLVTSCEAGGSHRMEIATSVSFRAKHKSGLTFRWSFDIEDRDANGKGHYQIQMAAMAEKKKAKFRVGQVVSWIRYPHQPVFMRVAEAMPPYGDGRADDHWLYKLDGENRLGKFWRENELRKLTSREVGPRPRPQPTKRGR